MHSGSSKENSIIEKVAVRFAGDSGDGMQLTGSRFTEETALYGNDLATRPDFPAEIRAPAGSIFGVSAFQIQFGSEKVFTAGDDVDVLVAMNPAALKANIEDLRQNGLLICNSDAFTKKNLSKAGYDSNPLSENHLQSKYQLIEAPITSLTHLALEDLKLNKSTTDKCKNFFALGVICWLYSRGREQTEKWISKKFARNPEIARANSLALQAGMSYANASELFPSSYVVQPASREKGLYRNINGNQAIALALTAAQVSSGLPMTYAGYPITPASEILHQLSAMRDFDLKAVQAEDEIAACCIALGCSYAGGIGVTASSGPGILLKQESIGLAVMTELPLVVVNVQRAGPSTGMPTKTEQADLLSALYGRNGECPLVVIAISSPADAFDCTFQACKIAIEHMTPVILLSDGHIGNGSEPWKIADVDNLPAIKPRFPAPVTEGSEARPYDRDPETLARSWYKPGTPGAEHRIGGLEKQDLSGNISYDADNHQKMVNLRSEKIQRVAATYPATEFYGQSDAKLLLISWGSTFAPVRAAVNKALEENYSVAHIHLRYINPLPQDFIQIIRKHSQILVAELNSGQLADILQAKLCHAVHRLNKIKGQQLKVLEVFSELEKFCKGNR